MQSPVSSKYFEILSHPIRFSILAFIDISTKNYSEIMEGISTDEVEVKSNKLNFHLKKMLEEGILEKNDKAYSLSELGVKLLSLVYQFENLDTAQFPLRKEQEPIIQGNSTSENRLSSKDLPMIKRIDGVPPLVSIFEYFEGKHYEFMEEKYSLQLPGPISTDISPVTWIIDFLKNINPLLENEKSSEWLIDRYLKLGYGTRGLQDYGLMDASLSVPPLDTLFSTILELLELRGKVGLYGKTGMGKSRNELYTASYWIRKYKTPVFYIQNPHYLQVKDYEKLHEVLLTTVSGERRSPKYLVIIEDAHLTNKEQLNALIKLISGASNKTYAVLVSFTDIQLLNENYRSEVPNLEQIEQLRRELMPDEYSEHLDLNKHWQLLRPYFNEWIKWVAADILFDYLPRIELRKDRLHVYSSPWSFVVSLGFLKGSLVQLQKSTSINSFPLVLYHFLALMYVMRDEKSISLTSLKDVFQKYLKNDLEESYGKEWESQLINLLNTWTDPTSRLLPPYKYYQRENTMLKESYIYFYHLEWANEVCNYLENESPQLQATFDKFLGTIFPLLRKFWDTLQEHKLLNEETFPVWLRNNVRYDMSSKNELILASLSLDSKQKKVLKENKSSESIVNDLKQSEMVNWLFIKSVINS